MPKTVTANYDVRTGCRETVPYIVRRIVEPLNLGRPEWHRTAYAATIGADSVTVIPTAARD